MGCDAKEKDMSGKKMMASRIKAMMKSKKKGSK